MKSKGIVEWIQVCGGGELGGHLAVRRAQKSKAKNSLGVVALLALVLTTQYVLMCSTRPQKALKTIKIDKNAPLPIVPFVFPSLYFQYTITEEEEKVS